MSSWPTAMLRPKRCSVDDQTTKVPREVVGSRCPARVQVGPGNPARGQRPARQLKVLRKRVGRAEAARVSSFWTSGLFDEDRKIRFCRLADFARAARPLGKPAHA